MKMRDPATIGLFIVLTAALSAVDDESRQEPTCDSMIAERVERANRAERMTYISSPNRRIERLDKAIAARCSPA